MKPRKKITGVCNLYGTPAVIVLVDWLVCKRPVNERDPGAFFVPKFWHPPAAPLLSCQSIDDKSLFYRTIVVNEEQQRIGSNQRLTARRIEDAHQVLGHQAWKVQTYAQSFIRVVTNTSA